MESDSAASGNIVKFKIWFMGQEYILYLCILLSNNIIKKKLKVKDIFMNQSTNQRMVINQSTQIYFELQFIYG